MKAVGGDSCDWVVPIRPEANISSNAVPEVNDSLRNETSLNNLAVVGDTASVYLTLLVVMH